MNWRIKGAIQQALGHLPGGERAHYLLQRKVGGLRNFERECDIKVDDLRIMVGHLRSAGVDLGRARLLEIGTGWYPTFPFALHLLGVPSIATFDLNRYLKPDLVQRLAARLGHHLALLAELAGVDEASVRARHAALRAEVDRAITSGTLDLRQITGGAIAYHAPADAAATGLPAGSVDVIFSNSVLEHVPGPVIDAMFAEAARVLAPSGLMFHSVNCGDHYAYSDKTINQLHYLQFDEASWRRWNNAFLYQNRLRAIDFVQAAERAGFSITLNTATARPERLAQLDAIAVDPHFARYSREQLAITSIDFIGRPPTRAAGARA
jgi:SAM-dependent methyltransferase